MDNDSKWIVRGYEFTTEEETKTACLEYSKIKKIEKKMDYTNPKMVYQLYTKAVDGKVFKTVVGYEYLRKLQKYLLDKNIDAVKVKPIPVIPVEMEKEQPVSGGNVVKKQSNVKTKSDALLKYCIVVLLILVISMLGISMTSDRPTILNYERTLQNKYAQWEEELQQREHVVKEKERELRISQDS